MAKSARASAVKKNKANLKKKVFGPVESARNERLNAKLLELANQAKPPRREMEVEQNESKESANGSQEAKEERSNRSYQRQKAAKVARVEKKRVRKPKNSIVFKQHPMKAKKGKKR